MDSAIKVIELKISDMEQSILISKVFIENIKKVKEMIKLGN